MPRLGRIDLVYRYQSKAALTRMAEERADSLRELERELRRQRRESAAIRRQERAAKTHHVSEAA